jgi:hypothetical protein
LFVQERKISEELKKLLTLEKGKVEKFDQELAKSKETTCSLKRSIGTLQGQRDVLLKTHKDLEVQFNAHWSSTSKTSTNNKASTSQVSVKTSDDQIAQENDHFKREVKKLELEVNKLMKQANRSNVVKKLEKVKTVPKIASQPPKKQVQNEKDEKIEYARSVFLNGRRPHIKSKIGYKNSDKHNSRVNTKGQKFIKFTKANAQEEKKQSIKTTNNASYSYTNASHVSDMSYHDFDAFYVLMRNNFGKIIALHVGPHHKISKTYVWVPKCLFTNLRGHNQTWAPKIKA